MSYKTEGLRKARKNIVLSASFPLAVGMSYDYCERFILNKVQMQWMWKQPFCREASIFMKDEV